VIVPRVPGGEAAASPPAARPGRLPDSVTVVRPARIARAVRLARAAGLAGALVALLAACAAPVPRPPGAPERVELVGVPFHAQRDYECGPASLAMLLNAAGVAVAPEELVPQVYLPARRGSLQAEMIAATRRHGRVAYVLPPRVDALRAELAAGRPAIVLQNFGSRGRPSWHYAVAIGYDPGHVLLRSGATARERLRDSRFEGTWERADRWALVALRPGELPATAEPTRYLAAAAAFEAVAAPSEAGAAYLAATQRWPDAAAAWLGLGNARTRQGDGAAAEAAFRAALDAAPANAAARNNLAATLAARGCVSAARREIELALRDATATPLEAAVAATRDELAGRPARPDDDGATCPAH
jgi:tetratricopeptide (TPR) repeat protein